MRKLLQVAGMWTVSVVIAGFLAGVAASSIMWFNGRNGSWQRESTLAASTGAAGPSDMTHRLARVTTAVWRSLHTPSYAAYQKSHPNQAYFDYEGLREVSAGVVVLFDGFTVGVDFQPIARISSVTGDLPKGVLREDIPVGRPLDLTATGASVEVGVPRLVPNPDDGGQALEVDLLWANAALSGSEECLTEVGGADLPDASREAVEVPAPMVTGARDSVLYVEFSGIPDAAQGEPAVTCGPF